MKFLPSQLTYLLSEPETRRNLAALLRYVAVLGATIVLYSVLFHAIMVHEGQDHSWLTGFYWTLTVMSTLGFGDITFQSDLGRVFSIVVLLTGIVMLLIVLPFTFIRFFYAPWLEAQVRLRAPRSVPETMRDHVVLCRHDEIAAGLIPLLRNAGIPYCVLEPDASAAAHLHADGLSVVAGEPTAPATHLAAGVGRARLLFTNLGDAQNSNATLAAREVAPDATILCLAEEENAIDVLELSGASKVLPLKRELGEHLASRVSVGAPRAHAVGRFEDLVIAEFPIEQTSLAGRTVRDTRLRELTGISVVGVWERGRLLPAGPDTQLSKHSVPVVVGTEAQVAELDALFVIYQPDERPVLVIGGGKVGVAAARSLRDRGVQVSVLERDPALAEELARVADRVVVGDAADLDVVMEAGLAQCSSVVLTTNDDATNIFLAVYCRRLNPDVRIVSRISEEWNLEAIHRAGADFALSHASLAAKFVLSTVEGSDLVVLGEGAELFVERTPPSLEGRTLAQSGIGAETGLTVIALRQDGASATNPAADTLLQQGSKLVMLGTVEQQRRFAQVFGRTTSA
jgi:Trk K+ transport system NAD-binding subunit